MEKQTTKKKKTKAQIEADVPIIKPEDCPGAVITYFNKQRKADYLAIREIMQEELQPVKRFIKIAADNRIWLIVLSITVVAVILIVWNHLATKL